MSKIRRFRIFKLLLINFATKNRTIKKTNCTCHGESNDVIVDTNSKYQSLINHARLIQEDAFEIENENSELRSNVSSLKIRLDSLLEFLEEILKLLSQTLQRDYKTESLSETEKFNLAKDMIREIQLAMENNQVESDMKNREIEQLKQAVEAAQSTLDYATKNPPAPEPQPKPTFKSFDHSKKRFRAYSDDSEFPDRLYYYSDDSSDFSDFEKFGSNKFKQFKNKSEKVHKVTQDRKRVQELSSSEEEIYRRELYEYSKKRPSGKVDHYRRSESPNPVGHNSYDPYIKDLEGISKNMHDTTKGLKNFHQKQKSKK